MKNWDDYRVFLALAATGSMLGAARALSISQPTVGRRLDALEADLGIKLFKRSSRGLRLTSAGESVLAHAKAFDQTDAEIRRAVSEFEETASGLVKISTTECFATNALVPALPALREALPDISPYVDCSSDIEDMSSSSMDIVMRFSRPVADSLVGRAVNHSEYGLYASSAYLQIHGEPLEEEHLRQHKLIQFGERLGHTDWASWVKGAEGKSCALVGEQLSLVRSAVDCGLGIGVLPRYAVTPGMVRLMSDRISWTSDLWVLCHPMQRRTPRVIETMHWLNDYFRGQEL